MQSYDPQFRQTYKGLGARVNQGLKAGYELGPDLGREVTQAVRGAQTARGNILGAAPTAQEAFGTGQAALNLYNQRLGQAQNYLQGRNPMDMMGQAMGQFINPSQNYVNQGLGVQAMGWLSRGNQTSTNLSRRVTARSKNALQDYNRTSGKRPKSTTKDSSIPTTVRRKAGCTTNRCAVDSTPPRVWEEAAWAVAWVA